MKKYIGNNEFITTLLNNRWEFDNTILPNMKITDGDVRYDFCFYELEKDSSSIILFNLRFSPDFPKKENEKNLILRKRIIELIKQNSILSDVRVVIKISGEISGIDESFLKSYVNKEESVYLQPISNSTLDTMSELFFESKETYKLFLISNGFNEIKSNNGGIEMEFTP